MFIWIMINPGSSLNSQIGCQVLKAIFVQGVLYASWQKIVSFANNKIQSSLGYHENSAPFISVAKNKKLHRHSAGDMWVNNPSSFQTDSS